MEIEQIKELGIEDDELAGKLASAFSQQVDGLKQNQESLLSEKKKLAEKMRAFEGVDPEEYKQLKSQAEKMREKDMMDRGEFEKLKDNMEKQWREKLDAKDQTVKSLMDMVKSDRKTAAINEAVRKHDGLGALAKVLQSSVSAIDKDGEIVLNVVSDDGSPLLGDDGRPVTVDSYVESLRNDEEYAGLFRASGLSGGSSTNSGGRPAGKTITRSQWDKLDSAARMDFARKGGKVTE